MFLKATIYILAFSILILCFKMLSKNTVWDKLLSLSLISSKMVLILCLYSVYTKDERLLDVSIAYVIIGFMGIALLSNFIMKGGHQK